MNCALPPYFRVAGLILLWTVLTPPALCICLFCHPYVNQAIKDELAELRRGPKSTDGSEDVDADDDEAEEEDPDDIKGITAKVKAAGMPPHVRKVPMIKPHCVTSVQLL